MATLMVSYPTSEGAKFNRDYYHSTHIPLAHAAWAPFGLESAEILFAGAGPQPLVAVAILRFKDQAGIDAALSSPETGKVIGDVANFTNVEPMIFRAND